MAGRRLALESFVLIALVAVVGAACGVGGGPAAQGPAPGAMPAATAPSPMEASPEGGAETPQSQVGVALDLAVPAIGMKVIKTAHVSLQVGQGRFDAAFQQAVEVAGRHGGFVSSSQASAGKHPSGTVTLRVPVDEFEAALGEVKRLGKLTAQEVAGEDVTSKFVDLDARQRNWEAQETVLLRLMGRARTIDDSIKVQRELQDVQLAIEQIRGQLRVLTDQTAFSTITASMTEAGAPAPPSRPKEPKGTLARAWGHAREGFLSVIAAVVIGTGYILPFAVLVLVPALVWLALIRRTRARGAPTA